MPGGVCQGISFRSSAQFQQMPQRLSPAEYEAVLAERDKAREARYAERAAMAAEKAQGTSLERAKIAALAEVASRNPGGSLPTFLEKVSKKMGAKFSRPPDMSEPAPLPVGVVIATTLSVYRPRDRIPHGNGTMHAALQASDMLSCVVSFAGLRCFAAISLVCHAWRDAVDDKAREWGVLTYMKAIGGGHGQRKAQLDTPTWLCTVPVRDNLLNGTSPSLCILDSCNYRLSVMRFDGTVSRVLARVGVESGEMESLGELSQPSSICYDAVSDCAYVMATVGANDRRLFRYSLPHLKLIGASPGGAGATEVDAPEGMACCGGTVFVVDTARHRIVAFDGRTLRCLGYSGGYSDKRTRWHHRSGEPIFASPHDIVAHEGELFVSDTHNVRDGGSPGSRPGIDGGAPQPPTARQLAHCRAAIARLYHARSHSSLSLLTMLLRVPPAPPPTLCRTAYKCSPPPTQHAGLASSGRAAMALACSLTRGASRLLAGCSTCVRSDRCRRSP